MAEALISHPLGIDTSDATATENDILKDVTAYTANGKVEGTIPVLNRHYDMGFDSPIYSVIDGKPAWRKSNDEFTYIGSSSTWDSGGYITPGTAVEIVSPVADFTEEFEITSDKIAKGQSIMGVEGSANIIPKGNIVFTPVTHMSMINLDGGTHISVSETLVLNKTLSSINVRYNTIYNIQLAGIYSQSGDKEWYGAYEIATSNLSKGEVIDFSPLDSDFAIEQSFVFSAPNGYFDSVDITAKNFRINENGELLVDVDIVYGTQITTTYYGIYLLFYAIADRR